MRIAKGGFRLSALLCGAGLVANSPAAPHASFSGIYPHLAYFNEANECGTGAVVPWADRLWVITYGPHFPNGSADKLYEIDSSLIQIIRPESVGGTPANRMIHRESQQLFIGPYVIDRRRQVRVITPQQMPGRLTGNARHLSDPTNRIYFATMEEGFYEVNVHTLAVRELYPDANRDPGNHAGALLPGYHGKGLSSGQGRLVYANNGELSRDAQTRPDIASGALAEWNGTDWRIVRRNQFTEVTGPGGIDGNENPERDPIWSIGWDHRSLILMLLDGGQWQSFRLPKASHCYDGAHGWNTEWPRIRDIGPPGQPDLLMTMHGMFWRFPKTFSAGNTAGISPRSTYLKVIGDFARWNDRVVFGCDDAAKSEFLNKRRAKGSVAGPGKSQSNLWFVSPEQIDRSGPALGRGAVWLNDKVNSGEVSEPFLFAGFTRRGVHLAHVEREPVRFRFEVDRDGRGLWETLREVEVPSAGYQWIEFPAQERGEWIRVRVNRDAAAVTVLFTGARRDPRTSRGEQLFDGLARGQDPEWSGGIVRASDKAALPLQFAAQTVRHGVVVTNGYYELLPDLKLRRVVAPADHQWLLSNAAVPTGVLHVDAASVLVTDDRGQRFRLPKGSDAFDLPAPVPLRIAREVVTERDLFNAHGTFYELPAENAGGFSKIRPIATHNRFITDYCSWRGLLVLSGVSAAARNDARVIRSDDSLAALWMGTVDDLWRLGKAVGIGGPWKETRIRAGEHSDPYLMTGYDHKNVVLSHDRAEAVRFRLEVDLTGAGDWQVYRVFEVPTGTGLTHEFPDAFQAVWARVSADRECRATAWFEYR